MNINPSMEDLGPNDSPPALISCDNCDAWFDPNGDEDCQRGGDRGRMGYGDYAVPSLCPRCLKQAMA